MAADLANNTTFQRLSVLVMDDCMIKLEHERTQDRVRKILFDRVESVVIWSKLPWINLSLSAIFLAIPGFCICLIGEVWSFILGGFLFLLGSGLVTWYVYCRHTTIRITRAGITQEIKGIFRPGKVRRFQSKLVSAIRLTQQGTLSAPPVEAEPLPPLPPGESVDRA